MSMLRYDVIKKHFSEEGYVPLLVYVKEKHGNIFAICDSLEGYNKFCIKEIKRRKENGYFDFSDIEEEIEKPEYDTQEKIDALKTDNLKRAAKQDLEKYNRDVEYRRISIREKQLLDKVIKEKNPIAAHQILLNRQDAQYEEIEIEFPDYYG